MKFDNVMAMTQPYLYILLVILLTVSWFVLCVLYLKSKKQFSLKQDQAKDEIEVQSQQLTVLQSELEANQLLDPLTQVFNRNYFHNNINSVIAEAETIHAMDPDADKTLMFMLVNLADFEEKCKQYGQAVADKMLAEFGQVIKNALSNKDMVIHWRDAVFLVVCKAVSHTNMPFIAERIRSTLAGHDFATQTSHQSKLNFSIGISPHLLHSEDQNQTDHHFTLAIADAALHLAKQSQSNMWNILTVNGPNVDLNKLYSTENINNQPDLSIQSSNNTID